MLSFFKKKDKIILSPPLKGKLIPLTEVKDEVFSKKMIGDGFAIIPAAGVNKVVAPMSGLITMVPKTKHAIGMKTLNGWELLIHIGLDTVNLNGEGFKCYVKQKQEVKVGDDLVTFDSKLLQEKGYDMTVMIIFVNSTSKFNLSKFYGQEKKPGDILLS